MGTTLLQHQLSRILELPNLIEPFNSHELAFNPRMPDGSKRLALNNPYEWVKTQTGIMKLLATDLYWIDFEKLLNAARYDMIVVTKRRDITACAVSLHYCELTVKYHYKEKQNWTSLPKWDVPKVFVDNWIAMYKRFISALTLLDNYNIPYYTVWYEDYLSGNPQTIGNHTFTVDPRNLYTISAEIPYRDVCTSFYEVEERLMRELPSL